jgi:tape measure domain-containing protein
MPGELNLGTVYASMDLRLSKLEKGLSDATAKFDAAGKKIESRSQTMARNAGQSMENLGRTMTMAVSAPLVALGVAAVKTAVTFNRMERSLTSLTGSAAATQKELVKLREIAKAPGINFEQAVQGAVRLKAVGVNLDLVNRSLRAFANEVARGGGGAEELNRVTVQLAQMVGKGKVMAEDLQNIAESMPSVRQLMKEAFGTGDPEILQKLKVTGVQFIAEMTRAAEKHKQVVAGAEEQFDDAHQALKEALNELGKTLMPAATRAADAFAEAMRGAAKWWKNLNTGMQDAILKGAAGLIGAGGLTFALGKVIGMVSIAIDAYNKLKVAIIGAAAASAAAPGGAAAGGAARVGLGGLMIRAIPPAAMVAAGAYGASRIPLPQEGPEIESWARGGPDVVYPPGYKGPRLGQPFKPFGVGILPQMPPPEDPQAARYRRMIAALTASENAKKTGAAARRAATARNQAERLDLQLQEAMGFGWRDPEQILSRYQSWQKAGAAEDMGRGLAQFAQQFVAAVSSTVIGAMTGNASRMMGGAMGGVSGAMGNAMGTARNLRWAENSALMQKGLMGSLQGTFGGAMGAAGTAQAAAGGQVLGWMQNAFGNGGPMWDQAKQKERWKRQFNFLPDLAGNLADEFTDSFGRGMEKAFGKNPFGRALAHSLTNMLQSVMDSVFTSGIQNSGGEGGGGGGFNVGALLGKIGLGAALGGLGSLFGGLFAEGGTVPGPPGKAKFAVVHGGEVVLTRQQQAAVGTGAVTVNMGGVTISNKMDAAAVGREIAWQIQQRVRTLPGG